MNRAAWFLFAGLLEMFVSVNPGNEIPSRGHSHITSTLRGRGGEVGSKADDSTVRLCEGDSDKGWRGSKNPKILWTSLYVTVTNV